MDRMSKSGMKLIRCLVGASLAAWTAAGHAATAADTPPALTGGGAGGSHDGEPSHNPNSIVPLWDIDVDLAGVVALGSGCPDGAVHVSRTAGGLRLSFPAMSLSLPAGQPQLAAISSCSVRIPMELPAGRYLPAIIQRLSYTASKNATASGTASSQVRWLTTVTEPMTLSVPYGASLGNQRVETLRASYFDPSEACRPGSSPQQGLLAITVAFSAQKASAGASITMSAPELLLYATSASCP